MKALALALTLIAVPAIAGELQTKPVTQAKPAPRTKPVPQTKAVPPAKPVEPAADPFVGIYKLNPLKSTASGGQVPPELTLTIFEEGTNLMVATSGMTSTGSPITADVLVLPKAGGTVPAPVGQKNYDSTVVSRKDANTIDMLAQLKGKERTRVKLALSRDGKTLTRSFTSTNAKGQPVTGMSVLERQ